MKVYLSTNTTTTTSTKNTINIKNINLSRIKKYFTKNTQVNTIISTQGIFQLHKNKLMQLIIEDVPCVEYNISVEDKGIDIIIDYSKTKFDEECTQLPLEHCVEQFMLYEYSLRPGGQVHLVVEKRGLNDIKEVYFLANDDIDLQILNEDIISFLAALKLY
jgi:hypothetical protein